MKKNKKGGNGRGKIASEGGERGNEGGGSVWGQKKNGCWRFSIFLKKSLQGVVVGYTNLIVLPHDFHLKIILAALNAGDVIVVFFTNCAKGVC